MAHATKDDAPKPAPMRPTQGVGAVRSTDPVPVADRVQQMGRPYSMTPIQTQETKPADPVLFADIDPALVARVHPRPYQGENSPEAEAAMRQGWETHDQGWHLRANADIDREDESGTLAPPTDQPASGIPQTAPTRPNEGGMNTQLTAAGEAFPIQQHVDTTPQRGRREGPEAAAEAAQREAHEDEDRKRKAADDKKRDAHK